MGSAAHAISDEISVLILAGGRGTRLRPATGAVPKPIVPVAGRPFLDHLLDQVRAAGFDRVTLGVGYGASAVEQTIGQARRGLDIHYAYETQPLGTAGAIRNALDVCQAPEILVLNGDSYCDIDLAEFVAAHRERGTPASMVLVECPDRSRFGGTDTDPQGQVIAFHEKRENAGPGLINAGIYLLARRDIAAWPDVPLSLEHDILPDLIEQGLFGWQADADFIDIGTPESYGRAQTFFASEAAA